ncbi:hypothetical protein FO519_003164 [Halicephalobus sp. NKZ332]|nr:hypothetical protein FO519_003164 [Halicephalobus sp. NKZ332]
MFRLDICIAEDDISRDLCQAYKVTVTASVIAFIINIVVCTYSFTGSTFSPNTAIFRTNLVIDIISCVGFMLDSFSTLLNIPGSSRVTQKDTLKSPNPLDILTINDDHFVRINDCAVYKPFLFLILLSRQWISMIMLVVGLERLLYICYPLWFRAIRVRRTPIVLFTLCFSLLSSSIAYTNSLFVSPDEITYYSCEVTWAFGDNYGEVRDPSVRESEGKNDDRKEKNQKSSVVDIVDIVVQRDSTTDIGDFTSSLGLGEGRDQAAGVHQFP